MKNRINSNRHGLSLVELMVALGIGSILLVSGMHLMSLMLEIMVQGEVRRADSIRIQSELDQLGEALDMLVHNPFEEYDMLEIETAFHGPEVRLTHLGIPAKARADRKYWKWKAPGNYLILVERDLEMQSIHGELFPLVLRFPNSGNSRFREGVAIHGNW
jgi:prepilin-type N-terminal cleavage/methylation domain-containing protein